MRPPCLVDSSRDLSDCITAILAESGVEEHTGIHKVWDLNVGDEQDLGTSASANTGAGSGRPVLSAIADIDASLIRDKGEILDRARCALGSASEEDFLRAWHAHTALTDPAGRVVQHLRAAAGAEQCTHAWVKMFHFLNAFQELVSVRDREDEDGVVRAGKPEDDAGRELCSLHLCEAPGSFVAALNHFLRTKRPALEWRWLASTLIGDAGPGDDEAGAAKLQRDPIAQRLATGRQRRSTSSLIRSTLDSWYFGADGSGDLLRRGNVAALRARARAALGRAGLVTADGSVDCSRDPAHQERDVAPLLRAEAVCALGVLARGGALVLKLFTFAAPPTLATLRLLSERFARVVLAKPPTSRQGNSEVYAVCCGFRGLAGEGASEAEEEAAWELLLSRLDPPGGPEGGGRWEAEESWSATAWLANVERGARLFARMQTEAMRANCALWERALAVQPGRVARANAGDRAPCYAGRDAHRSPHPS